MCQTCREVRWRYRGDLTDIAFTPGGVSECEYGGASSRPHVEVRQVYKIWTRVGKEKLLVRKGLAKQNKPD